MNTQVIQYFKAIDYKCLLLFLLGGLEPTEVKAKGKGFIWVHLLQRTLKSDIRWSPLPMRQFFLKQAEWLAVDRNTGHSG